MTHQRYIVFNSRGPDRAAKGRWKIEGPGLNPPLFFRDRTEAQVMRRALEQAFHAGREQPTGTLPPIPRNRVAVGQDGDSEDTEAGVGSMDTITDVRR